jgi:murein DD-endopeptidase MepM/ murein hydrolase activator NlpD
VIPIRNAKLPTDGVRSYLYPRSATHHHRGVDLPAPKGTPVFAAATGRVVHASESWRSGFSGYGRHVVLGHADGTYTLYAHLETVRVRPGEAVSEGFVLGTVGNSRFTRENQTLESGGYHLHFEASRTPYPQESEAERIDPVAWVQAIDEGIRTAATPFPLPRSPSWALCPHCGGSLVIARAGESVTTAR